MIFRSGKHAGKTLQEVQEIDPSYIAWVKENRPEMLKERKVKEPAQPKPSGPRIEPPEDSEVVQSSIQPNLDFLNQKGDYNNGKQDSN